MIARFSRDLIYFKYIFSIVFLVFSINEDLYSQGQLITICGTTSISGTTVGRANNCGTQAAADAQYYFVAPLTGSYTFSTCGGATWDTYIYLGTTACGTNMGANDDACSTLQSSFAANLTAGTTYYFTMDGYSTNTGIYTFTITPPSGCSGTCVTSLSTTTTSSCATPSNGSVSLIYSNGLTAVKKIRITTIKSDWFNVADLKAYHLFTGINLATAAQSATTNQSSCYTGNSAYCASSLIDNNSSTIYHSNTSSGNEWAEVTLSTASPLDRIEIVNRGDCCWDRENTMVLDLFDASGALISSRRIDAHQGQNNAYTSTWNVSDFTWSNGATTQNLSNVGPGNYTFTYSDIRCSSVNTVATVGTLAAPTAVTVTPSPASGCGSATISAANGSSGTIYYQGTTSGGTSTATPSTSQSITSNGTYYFRAQSTAGCWGTQGSSAVTINTSSVAPTSASASANPACSGSSVNLTASGGTIGSGGVVQWYTGGCGTTLVGTGNPLAITAPGGSTTYYVRYSGTCNTTTCASFSFTGDNVAPTADGVTVNSTCWQPNNNNTYTITAKSTESGTGWGGTYGILALVNYQGTNGCTCDGAGVGGYFSWHPSSYVHGTAAGNDNVSATGGGVCSKSTAYGGDKITLVSCSTTLSGNQRTVNFVVKPNVNYPAFVQNDVSMYANDVCNNTSGWVNSDLNFATDFSQGYTVASNGTGTSQGMTVTTSGAPGPGGVYEAVPFGRAGVTGVWDATTWPQCSNWGLPYTVSNVITTVTSGPCPGTMTNLTFDPTDNVNSRLWEGKLCYSGNATYKVLNASGSAVDLVVPVRMRIVLTTNPGNAQIPIQRVGGSGSPYFMIQAKQKFNVFAVLEAYGPGTGSVIYLNGSSATYVSLWKGAVDLFDNLAKATTARICTSFDFDKFWTQTGTGITANPNPNPACANQVINLTGQLNPNMEATCAATYKWTGTAGTIANANIQNTTVTLPATLPSTYTFSVSNSNVCFGKSSVAVTNNAADPTTWTGTASTGTNQTGNDNWYNHGNWDHCVPTSTTEAIVNDNSSNRPIINTPGAVARKMKINGANPNKVTLTSTCVGSTSPPCLKLSPP